MFFGISFWMNLTSIYDVVFNFVTYDRMVKVIFDVIKKCQTKVREAPPKKKRENVGILKKTGGGGLPESHIHFLLFLTWETPHPQQ